MKTSPPNPFSPASGEIFNMKWRGGTKGGEVRHVDQPCPKGWLTNRNLSSTSDESGDAGPTASQAEACGYPNRDFYTI